MIAELPALADQAGHDELCAWAADSLAVTLIVAGQPREAASATLRGAHRVPRKHPLAARLHARLALCRASEGNKDATAAALTKAQRVCDRLPAAMPSRLGADSADHVSRTISTYAARCHVDLGDWEQAEIDARAALAVAQWSPGRAACSHLELATALAHLGFPDEAGDHGAQALAICHTYGYIHRAASRLDAVLTTRYPNRPSAKDVHDRYRHFATQAVPV